MRTIAYSDDILHRAPESWVMDFRHEGVPVHLDARILERGYSARANPEQYDHPAPPFSRLFMFQKGSARVDMEGIPHTLRAKRLYLLPARHPFEVTYQPSELTYFHLHVCDSTHASVLEPLPSIVEINRPRLFRDLSAASAVNEVLQMVAGLTEVLGILLKEEMSRLVTGTERAQKFSRFFEWLQMQPPATVTAGAAAALYQVTPAAFTKRFRRTLGVSFKQYITEHQIQRAQHLLLYTDFQVGEIAARLGHSSPQYFHRFFKIHCGCTPVEYRRSKGED